MIISNRFLDRDMITKIKKLSHLNVIHHKQNLNAETSVMLVLLNFH